MADDDVKTKTTKDLDDERRRRGRTLSHSYVVFVCGICVCGIGLYGQFVCAYVYVTCGVCVCAICMCSVCVCVIVCVIFVCVIYVYVGCVAVGVCVCGMSMLSVRTYGASMLCVRVVCVCGLVVVACVGMRVYVRAYCLFERTNVHYLPVSPNRYSYANAFMLPCMLTPRHAHT